MNKAGVFFLLALSMLLPLASAALNNSQDNIERAYTCLENGIANKTATSLSLQESSFGVLALGSNTKAEQKLESEKRAVNATSSCWPKGSCTLKETAQALLAYQQLGKNTDAIQNYLLSKTGATRNINWFLEIDIENHISSSCKIRYSSNERTITINNDMTLSGDPGSCLSIVPSGYWLKIDNSCLDKSYSISCDQDFVTTLLYQKSGLDTLYVSSNTKSSSSLGETTETITSKCFTGGSDCDYEGSLWAALALAKSNRDITPFVPYLVASAQDNAGLFPSSFIYQITTGQDHYSAILDSQHNNQYWQTPNTQYNRFYDSALALWALQGKQAAQVDNSKNYFLNAQGANGCWNNNNLRDTAFLLYAAWPDGSRGHSSANTTGGGSIEDCESASAQYACVSTEYACTQLQGQYLRQYDCPGSPICCSVSPVQETCEAQQGTICSANKECSTREVEASDTATCCLGICQESQTTASTCTDAGGSCKTSCSSTEDESNELCTSSDICCVPKSDQNTSSDGSGWGLWITIFVILIILVALAIVFRNRLQLLFHKSNKTSSSPIPLRRPPFPPSPPVSFSRPTAPVRHQPSQVDKEMEETLKKLRDISK